MASLLASLTGPSIPNLNPPVFVSAGRDTITVQWDEVEGANGYKLRHAQNGYMTGWIDVPLSQVVGTTCTITGLEPETAYVAQLGVASGDAAGTIVYSVSSEAMTTLSDEEATRKETLAELLAVKAALATAEAAKQDLQRLIADRDRELQGAETRMGHLRDDASRLTSVVSELTAAVEAGKTAEAEVREELATLQRQMEEEREDREENDRHGASIEALQAKVTELEAHNRRLAAQCGINSTVTPQPPRRRRSSATEDDPPPAEGAVAAGAGDGSAGDAPIKEVGPSAFERYQTPILMAAASGATALLSVAVQWMMED